MVVFGKKADKVAVAVLGALGAALVGLGEGLAPFGKVLDALAGVFGG